MAPPFVPGLTRMRPLPGPQLSPGPYWEREGISATDFPFSGPIGLPPQEEPPSFLDRLSSGILDFPGITEWWPKWRDYARNQLPWPGPAFDAGPATAMAAAPASAPSQVSAQPPSAASVPQALPPAPQTPLPGLSGVYPGLQSFSWGKDVEVDPETGRPWGSSGPMRDRFGGTGIANEGVLIPEGAPRAGGTFSMMATPDRERAARDQTEAENLAPVIELQRMKAMQDALTKYPELGVAEAAPGLAGEVYRRRYEEEKQARVTGMLDGLRKAHAQAEAGLQQKYAQYGVSPADPYGYNIKDEEVRARFMQEKQALDEGFRGQAAIILGQGGIKLPTDRSFGTEPPMRSY